MVLAPMQARAIANSRFIFMVFWFNDGELNQDLTVNGELACTTLVADNFRTSFGPMRAKSIFPILLGIISLMINPPI